MPRPSSFTTFIPYLSSRVCFLYYHWICHALSFRSVFSHLLTPQTHTHTQSSFSKEVYHSSSISIFTWNIKYHSYILPFLCKIYPFKLTSLIIYTLCLLCLKLYSRHSRTFSFLFPLLRLVDMVQYPLFLAKFKLIQNIIKWTQRESFISEEDCCTFLGPLILHTPPKIPFTPDVEILSLPFIFVSVKAKNSNCLFLKTSTTFSLSKPLHFHLSYIQNNSISLG